MVSLTLTRRFSLRNERPNGKSSPTCSSLAMIVLHIARFTCSHRIGDEFMKILVTGFDPLAVKPQS